MRVFVDDRLLYPVTSETTQTVPDGEPAQRGLLADLDHPEYFTR